MKVGVDGSYFPANIYATFELLWRYSDLIEFCAS